MIRIQRSKTRTPSASQESVTFAERSGSQDEIALELRSLAKSFGDVEAVRGVDLTVQRNEFLTVLGPSGSGKTTILRLIAGFAAASGGQIFLSGRDVSRMTPAERGIGMVFQNYALFPHMTAADNVAYGLKMRGWPRARREERVREILDLVGLTEMRRRLPRELSGGQQQRVALARALAFDPALLLMDEPLGALDRELRIRMTRELRRIQRELKATVVYVTHDREEALTLSDRIAIMHEGRLEALATPKELYNSPPSRFVASFFGGHNLIPVTVAASQDGQAAVEVFGTTATVPAPRPLDESAAALVVPTAAISTGETAGGLSFEARIESILYLGEVVQVAFTAVGVSGQLFASIAADQARSLTAGGSHTLSIDVARLVAVP